jgi:hypothetical protein
MAATRTGRRRLAVGGALLVALTLGCNPITSIFFLASGWREQMVEPEFGLASKDKKEVKVVILPYAAPGLALSYPGIERTLGGLLARQLQDRCKANRDRVTVVPIAEVDKYKSSHPRWKTTGAREIAAQFDADYVLDVDIGAFDLKEPGSPNMIRGRINVSVAVIDARRPDNEPVYRKEYSRMYPKPGALEMSTDVNPEQFRQVFLNSVAVELSTLFTAFPYKDKISTHISD